MPKNFGHKNLLWIEFICRDTILYKNILSKGGVFMRIKKYIFTMLAVIMTISCLSVFASANDMEINIDDGIITEYQIADKVNSDLSISGTTASYSSDASGGCSSITVEHTLQKHWGLWVWNDVSNSTFSRTVYRSNICLFSNKYGLDSGTYRVKSTFTLTKSSGQTEVITIYSNEKTVS